MIDYRRRVQNTALDSVGSRIAQRMNLAPFSTSYSETPNVAATTNTSTGHFGIFAILGILLIIFLARK